MPQPDCQITPIRVLLRVFLKTTTTKYDFYPLLNDRHTGKLSAKLNKQILSKAMILYPKTFKERCSLVKQNCSEKLKTKSHLLSFECLSS